MKWGFIFGLGAALALMGCDPPGGGEDAGGGREDTGVRRDGGGGGDAGTSGDGGRRDAGIGEDAGSPPPIERLGVRLDHPLVEASNQQIVRLTARCVHIDEAGHVRPDPGDLRITVDAPDAVEEAAGVYTFPTRGSYVVTCASASLGLEGSERVEVTYEGIERDVVRLAAQLAREGEALDQGFRAARIADEPTVRAAGAALSALGGEVDLDRYAAMHVVVPHPHGWPTAEEARAAGLGDGPDDAAWAAGIAEVRAALAGLRAEIAALPAADAEITDAQAEAYIAASERMEAAGVALDRLSPSPAATLASLAEIDGVLTEELPGALRESSLYFGAALSTAELPASGLGSFSLIGTVITMGIRSIVSNYSYTAVLKKFGRVILDNFTQLALAALIDTLVPPVAGAPEIDSAHGSAGGFLTPGNPWYALGTNWTDPDPSLYYVIFISPQVPIFINDVLSLFADASSALEGDNLLEIAMNIRDIINSISDLAEALPAIADPDRVILRPDGIGGDIIGFPALPTGVNCTGFPRVGTLIPVRVDVGRGPSAMANVIQEGAGACP